MGAYIALYAFAAASLLSVFFAGYCACKANQVTNSGFAPATIILAVFGLVFGGISLLNSAQLGKSHVRAHMERLSDVLDTGTLYRLVSAARNRETEFIIIVREPSGGLRVIRTGVIPPSKFVVLKDGSLRAVQ